MAAFCSWICPGQTNVLTFHNDNGRTGQNLSETVLIPSNVTSSSFGKLFTVPVDGKVDAQPLYVSGLQIPGRGPHDIVFAATEHDSVYAFDAQTGSVYWRVSLLASGETPSDARSCGQVSPEIGITSTPVIDLQAGPHGIIYIVAMSKDLGGNYHQRLHAMDVTTGTEMAGAPVNIAASYPGTGDNSSNGAVIFDPKQYKSRPGLVLLNGAVYTAWSSHCDIRPYTGWLISYNQLTLQQTSVFNFAPNGNEASIWAAGGGVAADANGNLFISVANGTFDTNLDALGFPSKGDYGNAFVKLSVSAGQMKAADYWTMNNTLSESAVDEDLGSGGLMLLPDVTDGNGRVRHLGTGAGKDQNIYLFDRDGMGKFDSSNNSTLYQELAGGLGGAEFASPAWFNGTVYYGSVGDVIRAFKVDAARLSSSPTSKTQNAFVYPGATPAVSANGASNAILWAVENSSPAVLHAYDANNLATEIYNTNQAAGGRDQFGPGNKFITPTIVNGKVFVGTTNSVAVFGLLNQTQALSTSALTFGDQSAGTTSAGQTVTLTNSGGSTITISGISITGSNATDFSQSTTCGTSLVTGASCSITVSFAPTGGGSRNALLSITDDVPRSPLSVALSGTGTGIAQLTLSATSLSFGTQTIGITSPEQTVTITNSGAAAVTLSALSITGANTSSFAIGSDGTCSILMPLSTGSQCTIALSFTSWMVGNLNASLTISDNALESPQSVPLSGTGAIGLVEILNKQSGRVLDVTNLSIADGASIQEWDYLAGANQQWMLVPVDSQYYRIVNQGSGKVLDVTLASSANGAHIQQWEYWGATNQQWQIMPVDNESSQIINKGSGKVLDVTGGSTSNGARIQQWQYDGGDNQKWEFLPITQNGYNKIVSKLSGKVLDVAGESIANGAQVQQWGYLSGDNQKWQIVPVDSQYSRIVNKGSGKVLDVTGESTANGARIQQWDYLGGDNQKWKIISLGGPYSQIVNKGSGKVLDVLDLLTADGTIIQEWDYLGGDNQKWEIVPVNN